MGERERDDIYVITISHTQWEYWNTSVMDMEVIWRNAGC